MNELKEITAEEAMERDAQDRKDRLWLAGMAMQGLIAQGGSDVWHMARQSWQMADAMLEVEIDLAIEAQG